MITRLLERDSKKRLGSVAGAEEVKNHPFFRDINWALLRNTVPPLIPRPTDAAPPPEFAQAHFDEF